MPKKHLYYFLMLKTCLLNIFVEAMIKKIRIIWWIESKKEEKNKKK